MKILFLITAFILLLVNPEMTYTRKLKLSKRYSKNNQMKSQRPLPSLVLNLSKAFNESVDIPIVYDFTENKPIERLYFENFRLNQYYVLKYYSVKNKNKNFITVGGLRQINISDNVLTFTLVGTNGKYQFLFYYGTVNTYFLSGMRIIDLNESQIKEIFIDIHEGDCFYLKKFNCNVKFNYLNPEIFRKLKEQKQKDVKTKKDSLLKIPKYLDISTISENESKLHNSNDKSDYYSDVLSSLEDLNTSSILPKEYSEEKYDSKQNQSHSNISFNSRTKESHKDKSHSNISVNSRRNEEHIINDSQGDFNDFNDISVNSRKNSNLSKNENPEDQNINKSILHSVIDYKYAPGESLLDPFNASKILNQCGLDQTVDSILFDDGEIIRINNEYYPKKT